MAATAWGLAERQLAVSEQLHCASLDIFILFVKLVLLNFFFPTLFY